MCWKMAEMEDERGGARALRVALAMSAVTGEQAT